MKRSAQIITLTVLPDHVPVRIDAYLGQHLERYSRTFCQGLIESSCIKLNENVVEKSRELVHPGDVITITIPPPPVKELATALPKLDVQILLEHPDFLVVSKPAGLIVHAPSPQSAAVTLVDWLTAHFQGLESVGATDRPGLVHRLDKDTSGLLLVARNNYAHGVLSDLFRYRTIKKTYHAVVHGHPDLSGTVDLPIVRDPVHKIKMTHTQGRGRDAVTHYRVLEYYKETSLVEVKPVTGRTHQIRVHMAAIGHPLVGDALYGTPSKRIKRHALHAHTLVFEYEGEEFVVNSECPADFQNLLAELRKTKVASALDDQES